MLTIATAFQKAGSELSAVNCSLTQLFDAADENERLAKPSSAKRTLRYYRGGQDCILSGFHIAVDTKSLVRCRSVPYAGSG